MCQEDYFAVSMCWAVNYTEKYWDIPSGKRLHNELENHHAINGCLSTISMAIFNSFLYVYQAG